MNAPLPTLVAVAALFAASLGFAQVPPPPPLPPAPTASTTPPPPPADLATDPDLEPQVTIIRRDTELVEEVRIQGELRFVKVTPRNGRPYYLVPDAAGHAFLRRDNLDISLKVPMWVLFSF
ncbi:MAG TPA: DUF2782 domain-containing protein [Casimicrobiaceae bacterium]|jgi:hypothetical protein